MCVSNEPHRQWKNTWSALVHIQVFFTTGRCTDYCISERVCARTVVNEIYLGENCGNN